MSRYLKLLALWALLPWFFVGVIVAGFAAWMREIRQVWWNIPYHWRIARELSREILNPGRAAREYADRKLPNKQPAALAWYNIRDDERMTAAGYVWVPTTTGHWEKAATEAAK